MDEPPPATGPWEVAPIGVVRSPFGGKFGAPRQPGLVPAARGTIEVFPAYARPEAWRGLAAWSHVWVVFLAHEIPAGRPFQATVRPPRLGGNQRVGVFASRSLFRPNRLGLSLLELTAVGIGAGGVSLEVAGLDLVDGTPVLDVKPYLPYAEALPGARAGFAPAAPAPVAVTIHPDAAAGLARAEGERPGFTELLRQTLAADPRPAFRRGADDAAYALTLAGRRVAFAARPGGLEVLAVGG
jgi:tRNA (adenine37-N6)-methyltransferase